MTTLSLKRQPDLVLVPSGKEVDLGDIDVGSLETSDDCWEVLQALEEKIIDIDFQIAAHDIGRFPDGKPYGSSGEVRADPLWLPKAKKALAWSRLRKADVQRRLGVIARHEKAAERNTVDRAFVNAAKLVLDDDLFGRLLKLAEERADPL